jgi:CheY-like chemotaxis protein
METAAARLTLVRNQNSRKFLVVDDEHSVRELIGEILTGEGYDVALAENGSAALALFERDEFDAVFTDVGMPGMSGWELAQALRRRDGSIPIAVITGWGETVGLEEQKAAGVDWVVSKPFTFDQVASIAAEIPRHYGSLKRGVA